MTMRKLVEPGAREQRAVTLDKVEFRAEGDEEEGKTLRFTGHAAVFDEWTEIPSFYGGSFMERIKRGAFRKVLSDGADVRFLINHDGLPLARTASGTMTLKEDTRGLLVEAELADTTISRDLSVLLERGDISQMSFGFAVGKHELVEEEDEESLVVKRTIVEFSDLYDVSPVTFPAYEGTDAAMRAQRAAAEFAEAIKQLKSEQDDDHNPRQLLADTIRQTKDLVAAQEADNALRERIFTSQKGQVVSAIADMVSGQIGGKVGLGLQVPPQQQRLKQIREALRGKSLSVADRRSLTAEAAELIQELRKMGEQPMTAARATLTITELL